MCFNIGYNFKNGKFVRVKESDDDGEEFQEGKGLLSKEVRRWKKQQETLTQVEPSNFCTPSKCNNNVLKSSS
ncbi:hypothetical protein JCGZ_24084 [Jatropha curcas]|uniref:Uncharacterized protein n=1 Tax=Jatropha curcas TaxID=180498 RepID=A0A067LPQ0_JATCU|nr:hypothetical protein JCGZ_24084 [Jatropha curcas]